MALPPCSRTVIATHHLASRGRRTIHSDLDASESLVPREGASGRLGPTIAAPIAIAQEYPEPRPPHSERGWRRRIGGAAPADGSADKAARPSVQPQQQSRPDDGRSKPPLQLPKRGGAAGVA
jgi:hypothetical protein